MNLKAASATTSHGSSHPWPTLSSSTLGQFTTTALAPEVPKSIPKENIGRAEKNDNKKDPEKQGLFKNSASYEPWTRALDADFADFARDEVKRLIDESSVFNAHHRSFVLHHLLHNLDTLHSWCDRYTQRVVSLT